MKSNAVLLRKRRNQIFILILIVLHTVGVVLMTSAPSEGAKLSAINLLICGVIVFLSEDSIKKAIIPMLIISIGGYLLEIVGIHTQLLFGDYSYGASLGTKFLDVPIIISLNWYIIVAVSANIVRLFKVDILLSAFLSGLLCVLVDVLIEPVAIKLDYWSWADGVIPFYNYFCWFIFSMLFSFIYFRYSSLRNLPAQFLFGIWLIFFTILNLA